MAVDKSRRALRVAKRNIKTLGLGDKIQTIRTSFDKQYDFGAQFDVIVSNPPYIPSAEIKELQKEVLSEPISALDGGNDGLDFYRCLAEKWSGKVKENGFMAFECGDNQSSDIIDIFNGNFKENSVIFDFNNIDRIVTFRI